MIPKSIIDAHQAGDFKTALTYYHGKLDTHPHESIWHSLIGVIHAQNREFEKAYGFLTQATTIEKTADNLVHLATVCIHLEIWDEAEDCFDQSLKLKPFAPRVHNNYGIYYLKRCDYEKAKNHFFMALSQDGTIHEAYFNIGLSHMHLNQISEAEHRFEQTLSLDPTHHAAHYQLALCCELQEKYSKSIEYYTQCINMADHESASHGLGRCYIKTGDASSALDHLKKSYTLGGEGLELWHNMGMCYLQLSSPALALEAWHKAMEHDVNLDSLYHTGVCYQQMTRYDDAEIYFQRALTIQEDHLDSYLNLIAIAIERFQTDTALKLIDKASSYHRDREDLHYLKSSLTQSPNMDKAPASYVAQLFDHYAGHYDAHVTQHLHYKLPEQLKVILQSYVSKTTMQSALDLGCGTGLCGKIIKEFTQSLTGIDLSKDMLKIASELAIYDTLLETDILTYLETTAESFDLVTMAELLPYIGDLTWMKTLHQRLNPLGLVVLSIEDSSSTDSYHLHEHARFAHCSDYVIGCMLQFELIDCQNINLRKQMNNNVKGKLMTFRKINSVSHIEDA